MSNHETQIMSVEDSLLFRDHGLDGPQHGLQGIVVIKQGGNVLGVQKVLQRKKNLVVRNGREMALRKLFNIPGAVPGESEASLGAKSPLVFGIGSGGTPNNDPFAPFAVTPADSELSSPISFRTTSAGIPMSTEDAARYTDGRGGSGGTTDWYKKLFSNGNGQIFVDPASDEVYNKLSLQISSQDARDKYVNELALYFTRVNTIATDMNARYTEFRMFSRITFLTEPLQSSTNKALDIDYYVYL